MKVKATFQLEGDQLTWLQEFAYKKRLSQSSIVRDAIDAYREVSLRGFKKAKPIEALPVSDEDIEVEADSFVELKSKPVKLKKTKLKILSHPGLCEKHGAQIGLCKHGCKK